VSPPTEAQTAVLEKINPLEEKKLEARIADLRRDEQAREVVRRERSEALLRLPPPRESYTLRSYLDEPKLPKVERIEGLQRVGQDAALIAAYKTGKTTLTANLAKSLADGTAFLDEFAVQAPSGRVGFWNVEMDAEDFEQYLREAGIENADGVAIWNLRGYRVDLLTDVGRDAAVEWLKANDVAYWIVDPWARLCAWSHVNENDNGEVGSLLQRVREVADDAGVAELLFVHHAGYVPGRARGASVFSDNADVLWQYSRDEDDTRYLHAYGRGIDDLRGVVELENGVTQFKAVSRRAAKLSAHVRHAERVVASGRLPTGG
jgi:AAA domain